MRYKALKNIIIYSLHFIDCKHCYTAIHIYIHAQITQIHCAIVNLRTYVSFA